MPPTVVAAAAARTTPVLLLVLLACAVVRGQECQSMYRTDGTPLLFGGVATSCISKCKPRDDYWGKACSFHIGQTWGVCNEQQRRNSLEYAKSLGNGDAMKMNPCRVVKYIKGRTLWLIGDSHSKTLYRALQCFLIDFWSHQECEISPDNSAVQQLYNLPASPGQSKCFHLTGQGGGRVCMVHVVLGTSLVGNGQVASGGVLPLLHEKLARPQDIFYINFGVWHKKSTEWYEAYRPALEALGRFYQSTKWKFPHMLFRETPAEHPKDSNSQTCNEMRGYSYQPWNGQLAVDPAVRITVSGWQSGANLNTAARAILKRYSVPVIAAFNISVPLHDNHIERNMNPELDCLHYCSPGVPEMWIWYLWSAMESGRTGIKQIYNSRDSIKAALRTPGYQCVPTNTWF